MLIGLISDSHNNRPNVHYALDIFRELGVRVVFHAGDVISAGLLDDFRDFSLYLTFGNGDDPFSIATKATEISKGFVCEEMVEASFEGKHIFMIHGDHRTELEKRIASGSYNYVIHGHTHQFRDETIGNSRVINPGALGGRYVGERSFATLDPAKNELQRYYLP